MGLGLTTDSLKNLKEIHLVKYGLESVPGIVSEDATTALRRLDYELVKELKERTPVAVWQTGIKIWGLAGECPTIYSADELEGLLKTKTLAAYVYVYVWVPILAGAPWFPFAMVATDNKFDAEWVFQQWRTIMRGCKLHCLNLAGFVSDGDSRLRKDDFRVNNPTNACKQLDWYQVCPQPPSISPPKKTLGVLTIYPPPPLISPPYLP